MDSTLHFFYHKTYPAQIDVPKVEMFVIINRLTAATASHVFRQIHCYSESPESRTHHRALHTRMLFLRCLPQIIRRLPANQFSALESPSGVASQASRRKARSAEIPALSLITRDNCTLDMANCRAASATEIPGAGNTSSRKVAAGCGGLNMADSNPNCNS